MHFVWGHNARVQKAPQPPHVVEDNGCWRWLGYIKPDGYAGTKSNGQGRKAKAATIYYEQAKGPVPKGLQLDHLCRNRACVNPSHLEPVTSAENTRRAAFVRLTKAKADAIRQALAAGQRGRDLARQYDVSEQSVCDIKKGRAWK